MRSCSSEAEETGKMMNDEYNLQRFIDAQQPVYEVVCKELREGCKRSHWIWFIFPQLQGLGHSPTAQKFALSSLAEAKAYLENPVLGGRLRECSQLVAAVAGRSIDDILGFPDNLKFRTSMTLFSLAAPQEKVFTDCLQKYYRGAPDPWTAAQLRS